MLNKESKADIPGQPYFCGYLIWKCESNADMLLSCYVKTDNDAYFLNMHRIQSFFAILLLKELTI